MGLSSWRILIKLDGYWRTSQWVLYENISYLDNVLRTDSWRRMSAQIFWLQKARSEVGREEILIILLARLLQKIRGGLFLQRPLFRLQSIIAQVCQNRKEPWRGWSASAQRQHIRGGEHNYSLWRIGALALRTANQFILHPQVHSKWTAQQGYIWLFNTVRSLDAWRI